MHKRWRPLFFMKVLHIIIGLLTINLANGQSPNQKDLVEILNVALRDNKLPEELINKSNPKIAPWTNAPFIVIKSDITKDLRRLDRWPDDTHVWILDYEDIYMLDIASGLIPLSIIREKNRVTLDFKTIQYPTNAALACHLGKLIAERKNDTWIILVSKAKETKCEIDKFGHKK